MLFVLHFGTAAIRHGEEVLTEINISRVCLCSQGAQGAVEEQ